MGRLCIGFHKRLLPTSSPTRPQLGFVVFSNRFHYYFSLADVEVEQLQFDIDVVELNNWIRSSRVLCIAAVMFFLNRICESGFEPIYVPWLVLGDRSHTPEMFQFAI